MNVVEAVHCPVEGCTYNPPYDLAWDDDDSDGELNAKGRCRQELHLEHTPGHPVITTPPRTMPADWPDGLGEDAD